MASVMAGALWAAAYHEGYCSAANVGFVKVDARRWI